MMLSMLHIVYFRLRYELCNIMFSAMCDVQSCCNDNTYRYSELRLTNQKMTRQLGEKDEQLQEIRQKVDSVSLELRKSEKAKREVIYGVLCLLLLLMIFVVFSHSTEYLNF